LLERLFNARSVAVVGASRDKKKVGHSVLANLANYGFRGRIYPVNPKATRILGMRCHPDLGSIPGTVDTVVVCVPARFVPSVLEDAGKKGAKAAVVISAGFREIGTEGRELEARCIGIASGYGMRVLGPNCLGFINTRNGLNASFAHAMPRKGPIAFFSQSGALCTAILDWSLGRGVGFSKFISLGNKADIDELDMLEHLSEDPHTSVILGYIEGVGRGREFIEAARRAVKRKPVILVKSGGTAAGARAASSHTGTLAGSERAFEAVFRQTGILRAKGIRDLFGYAMAFAAGRAPDTDGLAVVTNAGGPGIIAADACERSGAEMAMLSSGTVAALRKALPHSAGFYNPIDVLGDAGADRYKAALGAALEDPAVGGVLALLTPQAMTEVEKTSRVLVRLSKAADKPVLASYMGGPGVEKGMDILATGGVPSYEYPEEAIDAYDAMLRYRDSLARPEPVYGSYDVDRDAVRSVIDTANRDGIKELGERDARGVIEAYGFRLPKNVLATTSAEAVKAAREIGYPVVMKIASPDILHKTDVGGVALGLSSDDEVRKAFLRITSSARGMMPEAAVWGCMVQETVGGGREVILGMSLDPQFGPLVMFGSGGIYVEALGDVTFRVAPVDEASAREMITEIRAYPILRGVRGEPPSDLDAVAESIMRLSQLATDFPEVVELDINPLVVWPEGGGTAAIDARITLA